VKSKDDVMRSFAIMSMVAGVKNYKRLASGLYTIYGTIHDWSGCKPMCKDNGALDHNN